MPVNMHPLESETSQIAGRFYGPSSVEVTDDTNDQGYFIRATVQPQDGRYVLSSVTFSQIGDGPPVQRRDVGMVPLDNFVRAAAEFVLMRVTDDEQQQFSELVNATAPDGSPMVAAPSSEMKRILVATKGKTPRTDEDYRRIADLYRWLRILEGKPTAALATHLEVSRATVQRWTAKAVEKGYLTSEERVR